MNQWFRFYHEALDDPKVQTLDAETFRDWVNLLCLCCRLGGELPKATQDIAFALRRSLDGCSTVLSRLADAGLLDRRNGGPNGMHYAIHGWDKRQYKSDTSTDRVKRYRERYKNVTETPNATPPDTDTDTDIIREVASLPSPPKKKATEGRTGSRLAPDWQPSEADKKFATELGVPWNSEAEKFRDYWSAQAGAKGRKADWTATWRNWIRRAAERRTSWTPITASVTPPPKVKPPKEDFCDQVRQQFYEDTIGHRYAQFLRGYWNEKEWGPSPLTNPLESELNPEVQKEMAEIFDRMDLMAALRRARWQQGFDMETWVDREENENVRRV